MSTTLVLTKLLRRIKVLSRDATLDVVWSGGMNLLDVVVRTASFLMLGRQLGPEGYGIYLGLYGILNPIGGLSFNGLQLAIVQRGYRDEHDVNRLARGYTALTFIQGLLATIFAVALASVMVGGLSPITVLVFAVAELICIAFAQVAASLVHVAATFRAATRIRIAVMMLRFGVLAALFVADSLTIEHLGVGLLATMTAVAVYLARWTLPRFGASPSWQWPQRRDVALGGHLSAALFSQALKTDGDKAILNAYGLARQAGVYGAAYRVVRFALVPTRSVNNALFHRFLRPPAEHVGVDGHMGRAVRYTVVLGGFSMLIAAALFPASFVLDRLLGAEFAEAEIAVRWLLPILPIISLAQGPSNGLAALDRIRLRTTIVGGASAISLVLYVVLIPPFGWRGAAIASIVSEGALTAGLWIAFVLCHRALVRRTTEPLSPRRVV